MPLIAWSSGLCVAAYSAFALLLFGQGRTQRALKLPRGSVWAAAVASALWALCSLAQALLDSRPLWLATVLFDSLRYALWYAFLLQLLRPDSAARRAAGMRWMTPVSLALLSLHAMAFLASAIRVTALGKPLPILLMTQMALTIFGLVLLEQVFRNIEEDARWSIKPMCLGLGGIFMFDLYLYAQAVLFRQPDADALSIRGIVHAMVVPLMVVSAIRQFDWGARVRLSPKAAFHTTALLGVGLYLLFLSGVGYYVRYFGDEWGRALQQGLLFLGLVLLAVLLLSGSARARLRVLVRKHLFHYQFDYREEWLKFTHSLSCRDSSPGVGQQVIKGLADMLESPAGALWTRAYQADSFSQTASWNMSPSQAVETIDSDFCRFIQSSGWVINLNEYRSHHERYGQLAMPIWLREIPQAWLVIPLMVDKVLIGYCVLASARTPIDVNWEVNDLLKTAGQQAAGFIAQMQANEALLEARKFDSFNRMSAFVVHDLKNIITQLSLMIKNAKRFGDNPEFQRDMLITVESSLERMRQMLLQLRQGPTPAGSARNVNLQILVERVAAQCADRRQRLEIQCNESVTIRGHEERLERVLGHMVQNAFDAIDGHGRVWVRLERLGAQARIIIGDTGKGMSASFMQNCLFKPFQTTKPSGMGIGAYESLQYVQDLGGRIDVQSAETVGTVVTLLLPAVEQSTEAAQTTLSYA
jgi:putative PEP-CTERM system histidine kinase